MAFHNQRVRLKKLGYTTSMDALDVYQAELLTMVSNEFDVLQKAEMDKRAKSRGRRRRR